MSAADRQPEAPGRTGQAAPDTASRDDTDRRSGSGLDACIALVAALRHLLGALLGLVGAEGRVLRAGVPLFFIAVIALIAFAVSLWVCLVVLLGWLLMLGTHSLGIALGLLVVIHAMLVIGVWSAIKYAIRQTTFPQARAELRRLGRSLRHSFDRATSSIPSTDAASRAPAAHPSREKVKA